MFGSDVYQFYYRTRWVLPALELLWLLNVTMDKRIDLVFGACYHLPKPLQKQLRYV